MLLACALADAEPTPETQAAARVLFTEARAQMDRGDYEGAEAKLEQAYKMFPGKGIAYQLALCYEHDGKVASAWARYSEVAAAERRVGDEARAAIADERAAAVSSRVPHLRIVMDGAPPDASAWRDGNEIARGGWGTALPVDPGHHVVLARASGYRDWQVDLSLREGESVDVTPVLVAADPPLAEGRVPDASIDRAPATHGAPRAFRTAALVSGVTGLVTLTGGVAMVIASSSIYSASNAYCDASTNLCNSTRGVDLRSQSLVWGDAATVTLITGAVALAAGIVLWVLAPSRVPSKVGATRDL